MKCRDPRHIGQPQNFRCPECAAEKRDCDRHAGVQATVAIRNLLRGEEFVVCSECFAQWVSTSAMRSGIVAAVDEVLGYR